MVSRYRRGTTMHGTRRVRQRMKLPARAVARLVLRARTEGIREPDMPEWLKIVVRHKRTLHPEPSDYVYYRGNLFIFESGLGDLITLYPVAENEPELEHPDWNRIRAARIYF